MSKQKSITLFVKHLSETISCVLTQPIMLLASMQYNAIEHGKNRELSFDLNQKNRYLIFKEFVF